LSYYASIRKIFENLLSAIEYTALNTTLFAVCAFFTIPNMYYRFCIYFFLSSGKKWSLQKLEWKVRETKLSPVISLLRCCLETQVSFAQKATNYSVHFVVHCHFGSHSTRKSFGTHSNVWILVKRAYTQGQDTVSNSTTLCFSVACWL
jgi:hypothetical protein